MYCNENAVYNIQGLVHLPKQSQLFKSLDISSFPYENYLSKLKRMVKNPEFPLHEIVRRISLKQNSPGTHRVDHLIRGESCWVPGYLYLRMEVDKKHNSYFPFLIIQKCRGTYKMDLTGCKKSNHDCNKKSRGHSSLLPVPFSTNQIILYFSCSI